MARVTFKLVEEHAKHLNSIFFEIDTLSHTSVTPRVFIRRHYYNSNYVLYSVDERGIPDRDLYCGTLSDIRENLTARVQTALVMLEILKIQAAEHPTPTGMFKGYNLCENGETF